MPQDRSRRPDSYVFARRAICAFHPMTGAPWLRHAREMPQVPPFKLLITGDKTSKEIADERGSALRTVETHRQNMSAKLGLSGSHSLLKFAYDNKSWL